MNARGLLSGRRKGRSEHEVSIFSPVTTTTTSMPRENSFSDSEGRSLTPDMEDELDNLSPRSPVLPLHRQMSPVTSHKTKSIRSRISHLPARPTDIQITLPPIERFRRSVRKVMHINRTSSCFTGKGPGAEPGVDVRRDSAYLNYGHIRQNCLIEIADYSSVRSSFGRMTNQEFINLLNSPTASERESWVKVRWINIGGISWDVIRALALKYSAPYSHPSLTRASLTHYESELHPLSLEDVLNVPGRPRSGADYYRRHLFIRVLSHTLGHDGPGGPNFLEQIARSSSPEPLDLADKIEGLPSHSVHETPLASGFSSKFSRKHNPPHKSATIEPGGYDVENVNVSKPPQGATYGSFYATYVRPSFFVSLTYPRTPSRTKSRMSIRRFSNSCRSSRKVVG